ncbi:hypothetical protein OLMES_5550 [Oleiphilus messinensis]|uniref:Uncharacterized protein n=1 Tax=Oleiphilus messinensis TaxID=141451 RepID=A0A1Y0IGU5_9GAMM|nr:hypothetical protein [Oleiphilus messinensis]ARU59530.1 hypothetical protein OLMES_5550 [Oleiphilus messinensis]
MVGHLVIEIDQKAHENLKEMVDTIRQSDSPKSHTGTIVQKLITVTEYFNESYFLYPTRAIKVSEKTIKMIEKATQIGLGIQTTLLKRSFARFSEDELHHIANFAEVRMPVAVNGQYYLYIPVSEALLLEGEKLVAQIRSNDSRDEIIKVLTSLSNQSLAAIIDYNFVQVLREMGAKKFFIRLVQWASQIWLTMNGREVRKLASALTPEQLHRYAEIIEERVQRQSRPEFI